MTAFQVVCTYFSWYLNFASPLDRIHRTSQDQESYLQALPDPERVAKNPPTNELPWPAALPWFQWLQLPNSLKHNQKYLRHL